MPAARSTLTLATSSSPSAHLATEAARRPTHMPELDGVRGVAILLVLGFHTIPRILPLGWTGVILFFVLSGFLITGILLDDKRSDGGGLRYFRVFYLKRAIRIFPIYYLSLAVAVLLAGGMGWDRSDLPWYLTYLQNFRINWLPASPPPHFPGFMSHTWSLAVEEQFYLVWPWLVFMLTRRQLAAVCVGLLVTAPFTRLFLDSTGPDRVFYYTLLPSQVDALAGGALLAVALRELPLATVRRGAIWLTSVCVLALLLDLHSSTNERGRELFPYLFVAVVALSILFPSGPLGVCLRFSPLRYLGKISYGLYLYHPVVFYLLGAVLKRHPVERASLGGFWEGLIGTVVSLSIAVLSWHLFEARVNALKRRIA